MIIQRVKGKQGSGKTQMLVSLAKGAVASGLKVAFIVPTVKSQHQLLASWELQGVDVFSFKTGVMLRRGPISKYDVVLLDDCHAMGQEDGDPVSLAFSAFRTLVNSSVLIVGTYTELDSKSESFNDSGSKYLRDMHCLVDGKADVYAVIDAFEVNCPARQHAIKKLLCSGIRGKGDTLQDLKEARDAIDRALQMEKVRALLPSSPKDNQVVTITVNQ